jgi:hypothetical protein
MGCPRLRFGLVPQPTWFYKLGAMATPAWPCAHIQATCPRRAWAWHPFSNFGFFLDDFLAAATSIV